MCTLTFYICILGWFSLVCVCSLIKSRCWLNLLCSLVLTLSCPVLSCGLLCSQRVNGAVCEYGLPAGLSAGAGEAVWDAEPSSGGGAEVMCRHPAPPPPQHAGNMEQPLPSSSFPPILAHFFHGKVSRIHPWSEFITCHVSMVTPIPSVWTGWMASEP